MPDDIFIILGNLKLASQSLRKMLESKLSPQDFQEINEKLDQIEFLASKGQNWSSDILKEFL